MRYAPEVEICTVCSRHAHSQPNNFYCLHWISFTFTIASHFLYELQMRQLERKRLFRHNTNTMIPHRDLTRSILRVFLIARTLNWSHETGRKLHCLFVVNCDQLTCEIARKVYGFMELGPGLERHQVPDIRQSLMFHRLNVV